MGERIAQQDEAIEHLKDEINIFKEEKKRSKFNSSKLDQETDKDKKHTKQSVKKIKRPGSKKKLKNSQLTIHEDKILPLKEPVPTGKRFKAYRDFIVTIAKLARAL